MKYTATSGDLVYTFEAINRTDAKEYVLKNLDIGGHMNMDIALIEKSINAYKNTSSTAGKPKKYIINPLDVVSVNCWFNGNCNPCYALLMKDDTTYLTVDNYGVMNDIHHIFRTVVLRKKDLI